ncbi:GAF and ANTAR domain-containing protein [Phytoactinopolyspora endophytica]|uniref:GAF and ANTAR domain-containing protein n=1 Tax=Phytoactinopolyspora endophytica TaxID=1642495 RepID=UPI00101C2462|nr:GAF and ANTAR domain-containing protein [Phytoactinopolyspora endophytica]
MNDSLPDRLAAFARELHDEQEVTETAQTMLRHASRLTDCPQASITLYNAPSSIDTTCATAPQAHKATLAQVDLGEGPNVTALSSDEPVVADDIPADTRWRRWAPIVAELGFNGVVSIRLGTQSTTLGTLSLYSTFAKRFDDGHVTTLNLYAQHASAAVVAAQRRSKLRHAIDSRNLIGQAQGILLERHALDAEGAYAMLQRYARDNRVNLVKGAGDIVAGRRHTVN